MLRAGLEQTAGLWPSIEQAYGWVEQAAHLLNNKEGDDMLEVRRKYRELLGEMGRQSGERDLLPEAVSHFRKVTRSYWPGLFHCYEQEQLPRRNA